MGVQDEWKKKFKDRKVVQPEKTHVTVPTGGTYTGETIGSAYTSRSKARGGTTPAPEAITTSYIKEKQQTKQELKSLQGKKLGDVPEGKYTKETIMHLKNQAKQYGYQMGKAIQTSNLYKQRAKLLAENLDMKEMERRNEELKVQLDKIPKDGLNEVEHAEATKLVSEYNANVQRMNKIQEARATEPLIKVDINNSPDKIKINVENVIKDFNVTISKIYKDWKNETDTEKRLLAQKTLSEYEKPNWITQVWGKIDSWIAKTITRDTSESLEELSYKIKSRAEEVAKDTLNFPQYAWDSLDYYDKQAIVQYFEVYMPFKTFKIAGRVSAMRKEGDFDTANEYMQKLIDKQPDTKYGERRKGALQLVKDWSNFYIEHPYLMTGASKAIQYGSTYISTIGAKSSVGVLNQVFKKIPSATKFIPSEATLIHVTKTAINQGLTYGIPMYEYYSALKEGKSENEAIARGITALMITKGVGLIYKKYMKSREFRQAKKRAIKEGKYEEFKADLKKIKKLTSIFRQYYATNPYLDHALKTDKDAKIFRKGLRKFNLALGGSSTSYEYTKLKPEDIDLIVKSPLWSKIPIIGEYYLSQPNKKAVQLANYLSKQGIKVDTKTIKKKSIVTDIRNAINKKIFEIKKNKAFKQIEKNKLIKEHQRQIKDVDKKVDEFFGKFEHNEKKLDKYFELEEVAHRSPENKEKLIQFVEKNLGIKKKYLGKFKEVKFPEKPKKILYKEKEVLDIKTGQKTPFKWTDYLTKSPSKLERKLENFMQIKRHGKFKIDGTQVEMHTAEWHNLFYKRYPLLKLSDGTKILNPKEQLYRKLMGAYGRGREKDVESLKKLIEGLSKVKTKPNLFEITRKMLKSKKAELGISKYTNEQIHDVAKEIKENLKKYKVIERGKYYPTRLRETYKAIEKYEPKQYKPKEYTPYEYEEDYRPYEPYKPRQPYTPYKPYRPYVPYEPYEPYTPYTPYTPKRATKINQVRIPSLNSGKSSKGVGVVSRSYVDGMKKDRLVDIGMTMKDAVFKGQEYVDKYPDTSFSLTPINKRGSKFMGKPPSHKFTKKHGRWYEKNKYRFDRNTEKRGFQMNRPRQRAY